MDKCIVDDSEEIPTRRSFVIEFIIAKFIEGSTCFEWHTAHHPYPELAPSGPHTHIPLTEDLSSSVNSYK
jgi:hypothetical protein